MYFSGQGTVYLATRNVTTGAPAKVFHFGNAPKLEVGFETEVFPQKPSYDGGRLTGTQLEGAKSLRVSLALDEWDKDYLAFILRGTVISNSTAPVVDEPVETLGSLLTAPTAAVPARFQAKGRNIGGTFTLKDSTGTPKILIKDTHWKLVSAAAGIIEVYTLGALGALTEPLRLSYTPGTSSSIGAHTQGPSTYYLTFDGVNTANANSPCVLELYKVQFVMPVNLNVLSDGIGVFELNGSALLDSLRSSSDTLGRFGKMTYSV